jgi:prepilin-type N-terminal cleavage/methylation domain-containing protein
MIKNRKKGFSLIEVLVATAILAIVGGIIFGFMYTSSRFFSKNKNEIDIQTMAQDSGNWLSDRIKEAGLGVSLQEEANGDLALEIYNTGNIYTVFYDKASGIIYCDESVFDKETGIIRLVTEEKTNILAEHVSQFNVDISVTEKEKLVNINISFSKDTRNAVFNKSVTMRNDVKVNKEVSEVYRGVNVVISSVTGVNITPDTVTVVKGATEQFSAHVTGIGFPSQSVVWSIADRAGLRAGTDIDPKTGLLTIDPDETASSFRVMATSVDLDSAGNTVSSSSSEGIVKIAQITYVEILNGPVGQVDVGTVLNLSALVHGENMSDDFQQVSWGQTPGYERDGVTVSRRGEVTLTYKLYRTFPTESERVNAYAMVRATSVKDPSKYADLTIPLKFSDIDINFDALSFDMKRNGTLDLRSKLQIAGIDADDVILIWSISDYKGLEGKVSIDSGIGVVTAVKDIDYYNDKSFTVYVRMISKTTGEETGHETVTVRLPKVEIQIDEDTRRVMKGTSEMLTYDVIGLVPGRDELRVNSVPAVRNTLLYMQDSKLHVSIGNDARSDSFVATLYLLNNQDITDNVTINIVDELISDDEISQQRNVEDLPAHFPVPGTAERNAPTMAEVQAGVTVQAEGLTLNYTYDSVRQRPKVQIGNSGSVYFYHEEAGTNFCWYRSNAQNLSGSQLPAFYAPTPGDSAFPQTFRRVAGTGGSVRTASINYKNENITYTRYRITGPGVPNNTYIYVVKDEESGLFYQYLEGFKQWIRFKNVNIAFYAKAKSYNASGQTAIVDSHQASYAIDGKMDTRWESQWDVDPQYFEIDLGSFVDVDHIDIHWENARAGNYDIQYSSNINNANNWTNLGNYAGAAGNDDTVNVNQTVRYLRLKGNNRRMNAYGYSIYEFEVIASSRDGQ